MLSTGPHTFATETNRHRIRFHARRSARHSDRTLNEDQLVAIASTSHPQARQRTVRPYALAGEKLMDLGPWTNLKLALQLELREYLSPPYR